MIVLLSLLFPVQSATTITLSSCLPTKSPRQFLIGLSHLIPLTLTNTSFLLIGSTPTLVWNLTQPFATLILRSIFRENPRESRSSSSILGTLLIVFGVLIFSFDSYPWHLLSPVVLANLVFPIRDLLINRHRGIDAENAQSVLQQYLSLLISTLPICVGILVYRMIHGDIVSEAYALFIRNAVVYNCYQLGGIIVLKQLEPFTFLLLDIAKSLTGIFLSFTALHERVQTTQAIGLMVSIIGYPVYVFGKTDRKVGQAAMRSRSVYIVMIAMIMSFVSGALFSSMLKNPGLYSTESEGSMMSSLSDGFVNDEGWEQSRSEEWEKAGVVDEVKRMGIASAPNDLAVVAHMKIEQVYNVSYRSYDEALKRKAGNLGNMVWEYTAYEMVVNVSNRRVCEEIEGCPRKSKTIGRMVYKPTANVLREGFAKMYSSVLQGMKTYHDIPFFVGIGVQSTFMPRIPNVITRDLLPGKEIVNTPKDYDFGIEARELLKSFQQRKLPMLVRGNFTLQVLQHAGYSYGISVGCPSIFLNKELYLGREMEKKYINLMQRVGDTSLKVAININTKPNLMRFVLRLLDRYPNSLVFGQGLDDVKTAHKFKIPFHRFRIYTNVDEWMSNLRQMDVAIGVRIHGNMIALGSSVPVFIMPPDFRVLELAQRMKLPYAHMFDERWAANSSDIAEILSMNKFDGKGFDKNRCEIAKVYRCVYRRLGLDVTDHVKRISEIC